MSNCSYKNRDDWIPAVDKNEIVGTVFLDLSKAFDLVNYAILLKILSHYGLHNNAIDWFKSIFIQEHKIHLFLGNNLPPGKSLPVCLCPRSDAIFDIYQ